MFARHLMAPIQDIQLDYTHSRRDVTQSPLDTRPRIVLQAMPFNHLGVWAYIAIGFIILASSTVLFYMVYTCCHSAQRRNYYGNDTRAARRAGAVSISSVVKLDDISGGSDSAHRTNTNEGKLSRSTTKICTVKKKLRVDATKTWKRMLEFRTIGFKRGKGLSPSESKRNMIHSNPTASDSSLSNIEDQTFEMPNQKHWTSPASNISDQPAADNQFSLSPPPSSAHKSIFDPQVRRHNSNPAYRSPGSPSPSYLPHHTLPVSPLASPQHHAKYRLKGPAALNLPNNRSPSGQFDSNNIRFVSPRDPFTALSNEFLWNDPKLSPIGGAIISPPLSTAVTYKNPFVQSGARSAEEMQNPVIPVKYTGKRARLLSPQLLLRGTGTGLGISSGDQEDAGNLSPISREVYGKTGGPGPTNRF